MKVLYANDKSYLILEEGDKYNKTWKYSDASIKSLKGNRFNYCVSNEDITQEEILNSNLFRVIWGQTHVGQLLITKFIKGSMRRVDKDTKVFLGGTCNNSTWRDELIPKLKVDYFNPVVEDWTKECQENERIEKDYICNVHLYVITKEMKGVFSIAEVIDSAYNKDVITIFYIIPDGFDKAELKSLIATRWLAQSRGAITNISSDINDLADILNDVIV